MKAVEVAKKLGLEPHPEGGFFRQTYRSQLTIPSIRSGSGRILENRSVGTAIYYLITSDSFSALHKLSSDETYHFYYGDPLEMLLLRPNGDHEIVVLGNNVLKDELPQFTVPAGYWQGTRLREGSTNFALLGTTVYPGFDFRDFEMGVGTDLKQQYPKIEGLIDKYIKQGAQ